MIPGNINTDLISGDEGGYQVSRSLRFNGADSAYLSRTPASVGNRKTFTWSGWVKRGRLTGAEQYIFSHRLSSPNNQAYVRFDSSTEKLRVAQVTNGSVDWNVEPVASFRDTSAWYHVLVAVDTTQATASNRVRIYVNGVEQTSFTTASYPSQNSDTYINSTVEHRFSASDSLGFDGYLADIHFIDGQALTPSSFTEVSATTGQLIPKAYTGSFGTNGFWLKFSDNSAATATTLGKDYSGNNNNWTPNNVGNLTLRPLCIVNGYTNSAALFDGALDNFANNISSTTSNLIRLLLNTVSNGSTFGISVRNAATDTNRSCTATFYLKQSNGTVRSSVTQTWTSGWKYNDGTTTTVNFTKVADGDYFELVLSNFVNGTDHFVSEFEASGVPKINDDSFVDTPTSYGTDTGAGGEVRGNYCTWNALANSATLTNGNLDCANSAASWQTALSTIAVSSGKWFAELTLTTHSVTNAGIHFGIAATSYSPAAGNYLGNTSTSYAYRSVVGEATGSKVNSNSFTSYGAVSTQGDVVGLALDLDAGTLTFYKNGVSQGQAFSGISGTFVIALSVYNAAGSINFGQRPFAYTAPSGFKALCDTNLPVPVVAKPSTVMDVKLWTGNGSGQTVSGLGFSPDFVWIKQRSAIRHNWLFDAVRGAGLGLRSDTNNSENTNDVDGYLSAFTSDGFSYAAGSSSILNVGGNAGTYVGWAWDAGSSTVTNTSGSISSQVRANASAGFSIVTYTGNNSDNQTVGHGLGVAPALVIVKIRNASGLGWIVGTSALGWSKYLSLQSTAAETTSPAFFGNTAPTSTVFTVSHVSNGSTNGASNNYVAYCFAPVAGYSSFGSYTGNGSTDGPFVFCNFRPRWILIKKTDSITVNGNWLLWDTARGSYNVANQLLIPNLANAEDVNASYGIDVVSNGFKLRATGADYNNNSSVYIYAAFAENPFQYARAR